MRKPWIWLLGIMAGLIIVVIAVDFFIDEPVRRYAEQADEQPSEGIYRFVSASWTCNPYVFPLTCTD